MIKFKAVSGKHGLNIKLLFRPKTQLKPFFVSQIQSIDKCCCSNHNALSLPFYMDRLLLPLLPLQLLLNLEAYNSFKL